MTQVQDKSLFDSFETHLQEKESPEEKLRLCLDFMKSTLSRDKTPAFRDFWACKKVCLPLFKEKLNPRSRTLLWADYIEISDELRKLKEILNEESSFVVEQLELAIKALEEEWSQFDAMVAQPPSVALPQPAHALKKHFSDYQEKQQLLALLNPFAVRVHALRKEIVNAEMRIRMKNRLFERLSKMGNAIFPRRKELISEVSELFVSDVTAFVKESADTESHSQLKNEVKALQSFAKAITINTRAFSTSRQLLSQLWDRMKTQEMDAKKEQVEQETALQPKLEAFRDLCLEETTTEAAVEKALSALYSEIKELRLDRDSERRIRQRAAELQKPFFERKNAQKKAEKEKRMQQLQERTSKLLQLKETLSALENEKDEETLAEKLKVFEAEVESLSTENIGELMIRAQYDLLVEYSWGKEERTSEIDSRYAGLKKESARVRKIMGGSSLDIEGSILYQEYFEQIKARLDHLETLED
ncbi:MAG: hypothetical protein K940chlam2_00597 [Chlamydiae bacterium]|nr:hypothetical protein [Chlamydiota bacterium]